METWHAQEIPQLTSITKDPDVLWGIHILAVDELSFLGILAPGVEFEIQVAGPKSARFAIPRALLQQPLTMQAMLQLLSPAV